MHVTGFRSYEYNGKVYCKIFSLEEVEPDSGMGGGLEPVEHSCDGGLAGKLNKMDFPLEVEVTKHAFARRKGATGNMMTVMTILDIEPA